MQGKPLHIEAPAKINLYLGVHDEKDQRGYHRVDSVMAALDLCDEVVIESADTLSVRIDTAPGLPQEQNSAYRAARLMAEAFGIDPRVCVSITKHIPLCAGLGGPSTDAAAVILGLCDLWGIDVADPRCDEVARSIGADVPFFLHVSPSFYLGGGDIFTEAFTALPELPVVLVKGEDARVSTVEAYRTFDASPIEPVSVEPMLQNLRAADTQGVVEHIYNNLTPIAAYLEPQVKSALCWLNAQQNIRFAEVCGSGACCFAVCDTSDTAKALAERARSEHGCWSCATTLRTTTCELKKS